MKLDLKKEKASTKSVKKQEKEKEKSEKKVEEYLLGWQRCKADFLNFKKAQEKILPLFAKHASEELIFSLLPVLDSFDLALAHSQDKESIKQVSQQMFSILKSHGLEEIETIDEKFNPALHESVEQIKSDKKSGEIVEVLQRGYKMHDKVIRPVRVKISA